MRPYDPNQAHQAMPIGDQVGERQSHRRRLLHRPEPDEGPLSEILFRAMRRQLLGSFPFDRPHAAVLALALAVPRERHPRFRCGSTVLVAPGNDDGGGGVRLAAFDLPAPTDARPELDRLVSPAGQRASEEEDEDEDEDDEGGAVCGERLERRHRGGGGD